MYPYDVGTPMTSGYLDTNTGDASCVSYQAPADRVM